PVAIKIMPRPNEAQTGKPFSPTFSATARTNSEFHPASRNDQTAPYASDAYASGTKYARAINLFFGQHHPRDRTSRLRRRQVTSAASPGHHIIAVITTPNPILRWPDQIIKIQSTALNARVSCR